MKGWRLLRRMDAASLIRWYEWPQQYPEPIGPPDTPWGSSEKSGMIRVLMSRNPKADRLLVNALA